MESVCATMILYHSLLHSSTLLAENEDFRLVFQRLTLCQGTSNSNVQSLVVDIIDDFLVEGTESFVISGNATGPASFVPGGDMVTINILDNDGECGLFMHTRLFCCMISSHAE